MRCVQRSVLRWYDKNIASSSFWNLTNDAPWILLISGPRVRVSGGALQQNPNFFPIGEGFGFFVFFGKQNESIASPEKWSAGVCRPDSQWWPGGILEKCNREPQARNLNECWTVPFLSWCCPAFFFGVGWPILMESLYFYNFLYGSFIYSVLIFMNTDR